MSILWFGLFSFLTACNNDEQLISFIGDSEVARWDLPKFFPSHMTENLGMKGAGIDYIHKNVGRLNGKIAVVLFGTNDLSKFGDCYVDEYVQAVGALGAVQTIVISIFPRQFPGDADDVNSKILSMNQSIKKEVFNQGWIYVDVFDKMMAGNEINWQYFSDGLHLSEYGYELVSNKIRNVIQ